MVFGACRKRACCVFLVVWVLFVNSIVCLFVFYACFFVFECFWLGLLAERCVWLVFLGFNVFVFVFVRRV